MNPSVENPGGDGESEDVSILVQKKGAHSTVWNFFGFKSQDDAQRVVICKQCFGIVAAPQGNTTNLYNHLKRHHRIQTAVRPASTLKNAVILAATLFSGARVYYALR